MDGKPPGCARRKMRLGDGTRHDARLDLIAVQMQGDQPVGVPTQHDIVALLHADRVLTAGQLAMRDTQIEDPLPAALYKGNISVRVAQNQ